MTHHEIVTQLSLTCPADVIYKITMETIIADIVRRMCVGPLELSMEKTSAQTLATHIIVVIFEHTAENSSLSFANSLSISNSAA